MLSRISLIIVILYCSSTLANIRVVESTPSRLILSWEMSGIDTTSIDAGGGSNGGNGGNGGGTKRTLVSFDGGHMATGDSGAALLPGYSIHAGVPPQGVSRVTVEPEALSTVRLNNPLLARDFALDPTEPAFASRWVSEPSYLNIREYRAAHIVLRPVYDAGQGKVQVLLRARVVIEFRPSPHSGASWEPRGDYERMVKRLLVNFNTAQGWQDGHRAQRKAANAAEGERLPFGINQTVARFRVGDGSRDGNEGTTLENTLIRVGGRRISEIFGANTPMASVALYAAPKGEMDVVVPVPGAIPAGVTEVPIRRYDLNGNGLVDDEDYIIAYVSGASDWQFSSRLYSFTPNRFYDYRNYWLAVKDGVGIEMAFESESPDPYAPTVETFEDNQYLRTPSILAYSNTEGGADFSWRRFNLSRADTTVRLTLPGLDASRPGSLQLRGRSDTIYASVRGMIDAILGSAAICENCGTARAAINSWESKDLVLRYRNDNFHTRAYYDVHGAHVRYQRFLRLSESEGRLEIFSPEAAGAVRYRLAKSGGAAYIVRVPLDEGEVGLAGKIGASEPYFEWGVSGGDGVRYMAMLEANIPDYGDSLEVGTLMTVGGRQSAAGGRYSVRDLRSASNGTGYLIITSEEFAEASQRLAEHKESMGFNRPAVVLLGDVMDQFGGGNSDPAAIRNFLLYVYRYWESAEALSYVTLMGAGHYDYKGAISRVPNFIPVPYVSGRLNEDFYVMFDTLRHPNSQHEAYYFMGRFPVKSLSEAQTMVDKVIETEALGAADFGAWRNRALMIADDDQQGASRDPLGHLHIPSTEKNAQSIMNLRPDIDIRKLYLFEHEWDDRFYKPSATRTLINEINSGVAVVNFFGHGSMETLADERILTKGDVAALHNRRRYPLFTLFSCSVGKFDHPNDDCIGEILVKQPGAGASVVIAGAREVFPQSNEALSIPFYEALFDTTQNANVSFGSALRIAKRRFITNDNRYYVTLGDPSITYHGHSRRVDVAVVDSGNAQLDTLKALQRVTVRGTVTDAHGIRDVRFGSGGDSAFVSLTLFNPQQDSITRKDGGHFENPVYSLPGSPVFSAMIPVTEGAFEHQLLLPMNLEFGHPGVRLTAYVWNREGVTGAGHRGNLVFHGSESGSQSDTTGPRISVRPVYTGNSVEMNRANLFVTNRVTSQLPLTIEINLEDSSGINLIGAGPDEGLTMEIPGALSKRGINHLFTFAQGSSTHGTALTEEINSLRSGTHELIISAQDLLGNVSKLILALEILDPMELRLDHVINVPNPVRMGRPTRFYYHHSNAPGDLDINVTIRVYSLGGRLLAVIRDLQNGREWLPADQRGNLLTPNVYLYQVTATDPNNMGRTIRSGIKKLVVHPPR